MTPNGRSRAGGIGSDKDRCDHRCRSDYAVGGAQSAPFIRGRDQRQISTTRQPPSPLLRAFDYGPGSSALGVVGCGLVSDRPPSVDPWCLI
jgi:hypothetical protein